MSCGAKTYKLEGNMGTYDIPIKNKMLPNAYVVAQLLRGPDSKREDGADARLRSYPPFS